VYIEVSDDDSNDSDDSTTRNFEDVIDMIKGNEFECLLDSDNQSENDSRCLQLGKYSKKKQQKIKTKSSLDNKLSKRLRKESRVVSSKKQNEIIEPRRGSNSNRLEDALENLEQKYKTIRNKRNKLLRKKKGIDMNVERQIMSDELKVIRREMKKLRQKQRKDFYKKPRTESENFIPLIKTVVKKSDKNYSPRKKIRNFRKTNKIN
jgi:hypothetical protein